MEKITDKENYPKSFRVGEIARGEVVNKGKASVFLDLGPRGAGIIYGREFYEAREKLKNCKAGDVFSAKVVDVENEDGYVELSLTKAGKEIAWEDLAQKRDNNENVIVKILGANKGGLLAEVSGIPAFLPVSQLSPANYPKVENGDSQKILKALQKFVGKEMDLRIFDIDPREEKLILSEKSKESGKIKEALKKYNIGDVVDGEITGVVDFGAFIKFPISETKSETEESVDTLEGLIHISELDWQLIENPSEIVKTGQKVQAKIIDISNNKVSLSMKALKEDPWKDINNDYNKEDMVKGEVVKINPFGAFVKISDKIQGLCHISGFESQKKMEETLKIGKKYNFQIASIDPKEHRMTLKLSDSK
jgi:small subunit ribosomal protein S1